MAQPRLTEPLMPLRDRVLAAATRLFAMKGFEGATVREIVAAAGVTKGALYHYFSSKDDLLLEIYARVLRMQSRRLEQLAGDPSRSLADRVHAIMVDVVETSIANLDDAVVFFQSMHLLNPDKQAEARAARRRYHERFRELIEEGQRTGVFGTTVPPDIVVNYHFGAVNRLGLWYRPDGPLTGRQVGLCFADMLMASLKVAVPA